VTQAESGYLSLNRISDQGPTCGRHVDHRTSRPGWMACNAILGATDGARAPRVGQHVETTLFDDAVTLIGPVRDELSDDRRGADAPRQRIEHRGAGRLIPVDRRADLLTCASRPQLSQARGRGCCASRNSPTIPASRRTRCARATACSCTKRCGSSSARARARSGWSAQAPGVPIGRCAASSEAFDCREMRRGGPAVADPHPTRVGTVAEHRAAVPLHGNADRRSVRRPARQHTEGDRRRTAKVTTARK